MNEMDVIKLFKQNPTLVTSSISTTPEHSTALSIHKNNIINGEGICVQNEQEKIFKEMNNLQKNNLKRHLENSVMPYPHLPQNYVSF